MDVTFSKVGNTIQLSITDDGRGFDLKSALQQGRGMGLISMQERVRQMGGKIAIESASFKGTSYKFLFSRERHFYQPAKSREQLVPKTERGWSLRICLSR